MVSAVVFRFNLFRLAAFFILGLVYFHSLLAGDPIIYTQAQFSNQRDVYAEILWAKDNHLSSDKWEWTSAFSLNYLSYDYVTNDFTITAYIPTLESRIGLKRLFTNGHFSIAPGVKYQLFYFNPPRPAGSTKKYPVEPTLYWEGEHRFATQLKLLNMGYYAFLNRDFWGNMRFTYQKTTWELGLESSFYHGINYQGFRIGPILELYPQSQKTAWVIETGLQKDRQKLYGFYGGLGFLWHL